MAKENGELVELQGWEVQELVDEAVAMDIVDAYVYSYKQGGKEVTGLTARAIEHICLENNPKISISEYSIKDTGESYFAEATAKMIFRYPTVTETKPDGTVVVTEGYEEVVTAPGVFDGPKVAFGRPDPFASTKALVKACRNARRQLISQAKQLKAKEDLLKMQGGKAVPVTQPVNEQRRQQQAPPQSDPDAVSTARKAMFAKYNDVKPRLEALGIDDETFKQGMYKNYDVESRNDMTEGQYRNAYAALNMDPFAKWILALAPKAEAEPEPEAAPKEETTSEDAPF